MPFGSRTIHETVGDNQKNQMNSIEEKKDLIINFWDIEEESDREKLIEEIRKYSEVKTEAELVPEIREHFNQIQLSGIGIIYEALSKNPLKWSNFFREEYERAFESAEQSEKAFSILDSLEEISFVDKTKLESRDELIKLLENNLSNNKESIRYKAIWYLGDWIGDDNKDKYSNVIHKIISKLEDDNWKIRNCAKNVLEEMNKLPKDYKVSFLDKLKVKFNNTLPV